MMLSPTHYKLFVFLCSIVWLTNSVTGDFTLPPKDVVRYEREFTTIQIPWRFKLDGEIFVVTWTFTPRGTSVPEIIYKTASGTFSSVVDRFRFVGVLNAGEATLSITDFTKQDEGVYRCDVKGAKLIERSVTVRAAVLSNVTEFKVLDNDDGEIVEGDNVTLRCITTAGEPLPRIQIFGSESLNSSTASNTSETTLLYHLERITRKSRSSYLCEVVTKDYKSKKNLQLNVLYAPEIKQVVEAKQFGCSEKPFSIVCEASGNPEPKTRIIGPDEKRLENPFTLKTFGIYRCEAWNKLGNVSRNITVDEAKDKPAKLSLNTCTFTRLNWTESSDKSVKYNLQAREAGANAWSDVITIADTSYSPSTNETFSKFKDYEFRVIATNCVGETVSDACVTEGKSDKRSGDDSNAGVIAGSVIGALVIILIIVIVAVYCWRRKRESPSVKVSKKQSQPINNTSETKNTYKPGGLLYNDSPNAAHVRPPVEYRQSEDDDDFDDDDDNHDYVNGPSVSNNVPSWV